ncbi:MAG: inositol monophosphatase [Nitrospirae bacterium]|nr:inositol monophosphatase [Nitrospirota bacterium]
MNSNNDSDFLETAVKASRIAGEAILHNLGKLSSWDIDTKQRADFVTRADKESEDIIIKIIKQNYPGHAILAEESMNEASSSEYRWIIDPLDGTTNFIHGFPVFSVSIALEHKGEITAGVVYDPLRKESFTVLKGYGAYLNCKQLKRLGAADLSLSLISTGFPFKKREHIDNYLALFKKVFSKVSDIRRAGSAALDLAYLAAGRVDGFFEIGLSPWDIAAGSLLIKEVGGIVTDFGGEADYLATGNIIAASPSLHHELLQDVKSVFQGVIER